jgi:hypothetical protein
MLAAKSQLHINPQPLSYTPVPKSLLAPSELDLQQQKAEQLKKINDQKATYANMVRQMYKPKVSEKLAN